ncbi:MAG: MATE family efflux transporter [Clostridiales bacterium]|nr:MATE family efflux transporter [Clostridiales bacterium]
METAKTLKMGRKKEVNMLSGSIMKGVMAIAIPIMLMNVLQSLFNIIDMSILKIYDTDGGYSVGAVGACGTLFSFITGLAIGIAAGANVVIAKYIGMGDRDGVNKSVGTALVFSVISGVVLLIIGVVFAEFFLGLVNCPTKFFDKAVLYFRLYFLGMPFFTFYNFAAAILRSAGDSKRPMIYLTIGGVVKVALTFLLVGVFKMEIVGVSIATISTWIITSFLDVVALTRDGGVVAVNFKNLKIYGKQLKEMLRIGIPTGLQQALYSVANLVIAGAVNTYGSDEITRANASTGVSIANNFDGILYQIAVGPSLAIMPYVSQNVGAKNMKRAKEAMWKGLLITLIFAGGLGALSAIFSAQLSSIMTSNPEIIKFSQQKMMLISSTYFICGINEIFGAGLKGMGKPMVPMIATMIFMCGIRFPWVWFIYPLFPNLTFLYTIWPIGWILSIIMVLCFLIPTSKKLQQKFENEKQEKDKEVDVA